MIGTSSSVRYQSITRSENIEWISLITVSEIGTIHEISCLPLCCRWPSHDLFSGEPNMLILLSSSQPASRAKLCTIATWTSNCPMFNQRTRTSGLNHERQKKNPCIGLGSAVWFAPPAWAVDPRNRRASPLFISAAVASSVLGWREWGQRCDRGTNWSIYKPISILIALQWLES